MGHRWLWPGFGENSRVLERIFERVSSGGEAAGTPIGYIPAPGALGLSGLDIDPDDVEEMLNPDLAGWAADIPGNRTHYAKSGDQLPKALTGELDGRETHLAKAASQRAEPRQLRLLERNVLILVEVVESHHRVPAAQRGSAQMVADEPTSTCHQYGCVRFFSPETPIGLSSNRGGAGFGFFESRIEHFFYVVACPNPKGLLIEKIKILVMDAWTEEMEPGRFAMEPHGGMQKPKHIKAQMPQGHTRAVSIGFPGIAQRLVHQNVAPIDTCMDGSPDAFAKSIVSGCG